MEKETIIFLAILVNSFSCYFIGIYYGMRYQRRIYDSKELEERIITKVINKIEKI